MQFHGGVYRSDDAGESWTDIGTDRGLPSDFGFPLAIDPNDPDRAFVVPLVADMDRVTPDGKVRVYETRDRGGSWRALQEGLPQSQAYLTVLRQAFCTDGATPLGLYFGAQSGDLELANQRVFWLEWQWDCKRDRRCGVQLDSVKYGELDYGYLGSHWQR
jgi:hypothetical protein